MADIWSYVWMFTIYVGWWLVPIVVIFLYKKKLTKYPIDVVVYEKRGKAIIKTNDVAGRFEDPITEYKMKMSKDTIPIMNYDWVLQCVQRPTNLFEKMYNLLCGKIGCITLFKYGSKQYKPINVRMNGKLERRFKEVMDGNGQPIWISVYEPINVKESMNKLEFDVIDWDDINHMTQELRAIALRRSPIMKFMEKYGSLIGMCIVAMIMIVAIYYAYQLIIDAGSTYVSAKRDVSGYTPQQTTEEHAIASDTPLGNIIPGQ